MDCTIIRLYLEAYERDQLDDQRTKGMKEHLDNCQDCSNELKEIQAVNAMFDEINIPSLPIDFTSLVMEKITTGKVRSSKKSLWQDFGKWGASFVAAGLIMLLVNYTSIGVNIATLSASIDENPISINKIMKYSPVHLFNKGLDQSLDQLEFFKENIGNRR